MSSQLRTVVGTFIAWLCMVGVMVRAIKDPMSHAPQSGSIPQFKWGQDHFELYVTVHVPDLQGDEQVRVTAGNLQVNATGGDGQKYLLDLELREEVKPTNSSWRVNREEDLIFVNMTKKLPHYFDRLLRFKSDYSRFKRFMDIDWTRWKKDAAHDNEPEGESAEDDAEDDADDEWPNLKTLTRRTFNKTIAKHDIMVVALVYPWCPHCTHLYESMSKAAKKLKPLDIAFGRVDARVERELANRFEIGCEENCPVQVFKNGMDPFPMDKTTVADFVSLLTPLAGPCVADVTSKKQLKQLKATKDAKDNAVVLLVGVADDDALSLAFTKLACNMRHDFVWGAIRPAHSKLDSASANGGRAIVLLKSRDEKRAELDVASLDPADLEERVQQWSGVWALPLVGEHQHGFAMMRRYSFAKLPILRTFLTKPNDARDAIMASLTAAATQLRGKMIFSYTESEYGNAYLMTEFGLDGGIGVGSGIELNNGNSSAPKYALLPQQNVSDGGLSEARLVEFANNVLAGNMPPSERSEAVIGAADGAMPDGVYRIVWNAWKTQVDDVDEDMLMLVYPTKHAPTYERWIAVLRNISSTLAKQHVRVATVSGVNNELPASFEWPRYNHGGKCKCFVLHKGDTTKPIEYKGNADTDAVIRFVAKKSSAPFDAATAVAQFHELQQKAAAPTESDDKPQGTESDDKPQGTESKAEL